jgi:hypothetical protein
MILFVDVMDLLIQIQLMLYAMELVIIKKDPVINLF